MTKARKRMQLPSINDTKSFLQAVKDSLQGLMGTGLDRALTPSDLIEGGFATQTPGGGLVPANPKIMTVPPRITGLTAVGAMDNIVLNWDAPGYANHGFTEVLRADVNDYGQAFVIASPTGNFHVDAVGSGVIRYYWVRAVSDAGVIGPANEVSGTIGRTGRDPTYVMSILTSSKWQPNTVYEPYQFVVPTADSNFRYMCIDGGTSGDAEPTWPVVEDDTVVDGTLEWKCVPKDKRVPFVVGEVEGEPAVFLDAAYIREASITTAMIKSLAADRIVAGKLQVGQTIEVGSAIWAGFSEYGNPDGVPGWWMGTHGGSPAFHFYTNGEAPAYTARYIRFDGVRIEMNVDLMSSADGTFDDLRVDSLAADRIAGSVCAFSEYLTPATDAPLDDSQEFNYFLARNYPVRTTVYAASAYGMIGAGFIRQGVYGNRKATTALNTEMVPYNERSLSRTRSHANAIGFMAKISRPPMGTTVLSTCIFKILDNNGGVRATVNLTGNNITNRVKNCPAAGGTIQVSLTYGTNHILIECLDDNGYLGFTEGVRLRATYEQFNYINYGSGSDFDQLGQCEVWFQLVTIPKPIADPGLPLTV